MPSEAELIRTILFHKKPINKSLIKSSQLAAVKERLLNDFGYNLVEVKGKYILTTTLNTSTSSDGLLTLLLCLIFLSSGRLSNTLLTKYTQAVLFTLDTKDHRWSESAGDLELRLSEYIKQGYIVKDKDDYLLGVRACEFEMSKIVLDLVGSEYRSVVERVGRAE